MRHFLKFSLAFLIISNNLSAQELSLDPILVSTSKFNNDTARKLTQGSDAPSLMQDQPGLYFNSTGGSTGLPTLHGLNDERIKVILDGKTLSSACANHMNPALSYLDSANLAKIEVLNTMPSVAYSGDSIAGTIVVESEQPVFTESGIYKEATVSSIYRSNNDSLSKLVNMSTATDSINVTYSGSYNRSNSYFAADGNKVNSTQYEAYNQTLSLSGKTENHLISLKSNFQNIPYQGFVNQYMDMVDNDAYSLALDDSASFDWGTLDTVVFGQETDHEMGFFSDEKTGKMPMESRGKDLGYGIKAEMPIDQSTKVRFGNDFHYFNLDDKWPAVPSSMMMGPDTYININDGYKQIFGNYAELEFEPARQWTTQLGIRNNTVQMDTGDVQPYNSESMNMMPARMMHSSMNADAMAAAEFNSRDRSKQDNNIDLSLQSKYVAEKLWSTTFGYTRKVRSPNLYERYAWGRTPMAMSMIGWYGDANGYVGDIDLNPEVAHTLSSTLKYQRDTERSVTFEFTPYVSYVEDYIDADTIGEFNPKMSMSETRSLLQFANHDARLYGFDFNTTIPLSSDSDLGEIYLSNLTGFVRGSRVDTGDSLYQMMPLNSRFRLEQQKGNWYSFIEALLVDNKSETDSIRRELETAGYMIMNFNTSYVWDFIRLDFTVTNLLDTNYDLPLGGVNIANWAAEGATGLMGAVPGRGQSFNLGVTLYF